MPVQFNGSSSGARSARSCYKYLSLNNDVTVFSFGTLDKDLEMNDIKYIQRSLFHVKHNFFSKKIKLEFIKIIKSIKPDFVFIFGNIWSFPNIYYDYLHSKGTKIVQMILRQEFFAYHSHAVIDSDGNLVNKNIFFNYDNGRYTLSAKEILKSLYFLFAKNRKLSYLRKNYAVIGSSDEQIKYYLKNGLKNNNLYKIPLFFDDSNFSFDEQATKGNYYVVLAQNLFSKGINLLPRILAEINKKICVKVLFKNNDEKIQFKELANSNNIFFDKNIELIPNVKILGLGKSLLLNSFAVINPSTWSSTTEFVLLETLIMGKPMFCFDTGIHKELFNQFSLKSECFDCKEFAKRINDFYFSHKDYDLISNYSKNIFKKISFNKSHLNELQEIFQK